MGIHGSPTCTLNYGYNGGAIAYMVGEPNRGLETMFIMMNEARFGVGIQGVALAERAYQYALNYAQTRVQGRNALTGETGQPIIIHPDVKRQVLGMRARVMAMRTLLYTAGGWFDIAHHHPDKTVAAKHQCYIDLLMPVAKGWCTEVGNEVCDDALQVFGGMGFIEETGIAQYFRDARIMTIYEGTTGIQANDLIGRKILREQGATLLELIADMRATVQDLTRHNPLNDLADRLDQQLDALQETTDWILFQGKDGLARVLAGSVPFLQLLGAVVGSWQMCRLALAAQHKLTAGEDEQTYLNNLQQLARFFLITYGSQAPAYARAVCESGDVLLAIDFGGD